ncbi:hypothetical protein GGS26DRAFT_595202 [Hypomontagnella submonticulosa]|nr:hypothetical protein GGS26DRAFT_595202 [Hypomontagnella submonticulosa]
MPDDPHPLGPSPRGYIYLDWVLVLGSWIRFVIPKSGPVQLYAPEMSLNFTTSVVTAVQELPSVVRRQVTLTQIITYPDSTTTAIVTLDRGAPPTDSPAPGWSAGAASSDGLGQQQIGIIVGCCIGAALLGVVLWCCCTGRCGCTPFTVYEDDADVYYYSESDVVEVPRPPRTHLRFPHSLAPPSVPTYVATDMAPQWTANEAANTRMYRSNYYGR